MAHAAPSSVSPDLLARSYQHCEFVAKTQAKNFYYSFVTLPPEKKAAMCAIYAFMRYSDDVSDGDISQKGKTRSEELHNWRTALDRAFAGDYGESLILPAFHDTVRTYHIPARYFHELMDGMEQDLTQTRYAAWEDTRRYCYLAASVVGFVCIHVWGFEEGDGKAMEFAEACGIALQLTNILRDVKEDAERDRIYLPQEDLDRFGVTEEDLKAGRVDERFRALLQFETDRAKEYYHLAQQLFPYIHAPGRPTLSIMLKIYRGILDQIEEQNYDVYSRRARVSTPKKLSIVAAEWLKAKTLVTRKGLRTRIRTQEGKKSQ